MITTTERTAPAAEPFAGDKKHGQSVLGPYEKKLVQRSVRHVPSWLHSNHLTMMTVGWSLGTILFGWLAASNPLWLFAMSAMVVGQYVTDSLDGAVGRARDTGLVKWGFFMDHFLDLLFAGSVVIGYALLAPAGMGVWFMALLLLTCATMAVSFLSFAATNRFQISWFGIGPTEIRIGYIALNTLVFFTGTGIFWWGVPLLVVANVGALILVAHNAHKTLWRMDMEAKEAREATA